MYKVKKFEISVVDRTYSKVVSDVVKFYSSDSALEVIFILAEEGYEFDSAELVLSNTDGSLITRPLTKSPEGYSYKIDNNIISHHGEWKGQVILNSVDDSYVSSKIRFTIEDDLLGERPPKLTDVYSWTSLKRYADSLVDELKQAVLSIEGLEGTFNANETVRQSQFETAEQSRQETFETNEIERTETFEINETTRQTQELEREKAESQRQTIFNDNEATRQENETVRQQVETQRETAESMRVANESERISKDSERDSKIDSKADVSELELYAKKEQEAWIRPTLLNGWAEYSDRKIQYRKDEFGVVRLSGLMKDGVIGTVAFILPAGYRPNTVLQYFDGGTGNMFRIHGIGGQVTVTNGSNNPVAIDGITFPTF